MSQGDKDLFINTDVDQRQVVLNALDDQLLVLLIQVARQLDYLAHCMHHLIGRILHQSLAQPTQHFFHHFVHFLKQTFVFAIQDHTQQVTVAVVVVLPVFEGRLGQHLHGLARGEHFVMQEQLEVVGR